MYRNIISCMPGSLYWKNCEGRYLGCNEFMVKTAGLNSTADIINKTDYELWPESASCIVQNDQKVINSGQILFLEETVKIADGTQMYFTGVKMPLRDELGNITGVICNSLDITRLKETEHKLQIEKEKAEEAADHAKSQFLMNISHDIRTPVNGIVGVTQLMKETALDQEIKAYADLLVNAAGKLLLLLDQIISSVHLFSGKIPITSQVFSLKDILEEVIELNRPVAVQKRLALHFSCDVLLPIQVIGDLLRIKLLTLELVTNALKFTHRGSVSISAGVAKQEARHLWLRLCVEDTGIGMKHEQYQEIFSKFTRLNAAYQGLYPGAGLGLSKVNQLVQDLEADIKVESTVGQGSRFTCIIPLKLPWLEAT